MSMPVYAMTYVVYWPHARVLKVGRAWNFSRIEMMTISGGHVIILARGTDKTWEREALHTLRRWFPAAFANEDDATSILFQGRGWSECFTVDEHHLQLAVDLCFESFARGNEQGVNEAKDDQRIGSELPGLPARGRLSETDSDRAVADDGHRRAPGTDPGADCRGHLPGPSGDVAHRGAHSDARRERVLTDLQSGWFRVDRTHPTVEGRSPWGDVGVPASTVPGSSTDFHGYGGSERAGDGAGGGRETCERVAGVAGRAGASAEEARTTNAPRCSTSRLQRSPKRNLPQLRTMRHRSPSSRNLGSQGTVHGEARTLLRGQPRRASVLDHAGRDS